MKNSISKQGLNEFDFFLLMHCEGESFYNKPLMGW